MVDAMEGHSGGGHWNLVPLIKKELQRKNWMTAASLSEIKVVIVNCNDTVVVVPSVQCQ